MQSLLGRRRGLAMVLTLSAAAGSGCVSRGALSMPPVDASGGESANLGDAAVLPLCQLTAVTDLVPVTSEIEPYAGLLSGTTSLYLIHPEDRQLSRVPVNGGTLAPDRRLRLARDHVRPAVRRRGRHGRGGEGVRRRRDGNPTGRRPRRHRDRDGRFFRVVGPVGGRGRLRRSGASTSTARTRIACSRARAIILSLSAADGGFLWIELANDVFFVVTAGADGSTAGLPVPMTGSPSVVVAGTYGVYVSVGTDILHIPMGASQSTVLARDQPMVTSIAVGWDRVYWTPEHRLCDRPERRQRNHRVRRRRQLGADDWWYAGRSARLRQRAHGRRRPAAASTGRRRPASSTSPRRSASAARPSRSRGERVRDARHGG